MTFAPDERLRALARDVRGACLHAAEAAFEDAGLQGLCADGRVERAREAIMAVDVEGLIEKWAAAGDVPRGRDFRRARVHATRSS